MAIQQMIWAQSRDRLVAAVTELGFSSELAELMARQLKSPRAIDRMTAFVHNSLSCSETMLVDEMLAICSEIDAWREKKASQEAQIQYNTMLYYGLAEEDYCDR